MRAGFEEVDYQQTSIGELILRRRNAVEMGGREVHEVKLNDEFLMSSLFVDGEVALTNLGLGQLSGDNWDIVVGGLGLGFTAATALAYPQVARMVVVEALAPVIDWHQRELVPNGALLSNDARCHYFNEDFFALARGSGFDPAESNHRFDAILLDIDHTPDALLNPSHADFYSLEGMRRLRQFIKPGGIFALWSNDRPDPGFLAILGDVFDQVRGHTVTYDNPIQDTEEWNGIYIAAVT